MLSTLGRSLLPSGAPFASLRHISITPAVRGDWLSHVDNAPKDPILGITERYLADNNPQKINLGVGAYRDDDGKPVVLDCVRKAERFVSGTHWMEYLPIGGLRDFVQESWGLAFGRDHRVIKEGLVAGVQSLSGTGSCRLMAEFQRRYLPNSAVYLPNPTWANHHNIWRDAGVPVKVYTYYKPSTRGLDFEGFKEDAKNAPSGSVFLLHACAHNPTGVDPTPEQWAELSKLLKEKDHFPFFDMAYQGFATGDFDRDAGAIRTFLEDGHVLGLSQSYAKNMGLYGQRVGAFSMVCGSPKEAAAVESQMKAIARPMYSNPALHGALLAAKVLTTEELRAEWYSEVKQMANRIKDMRHLLRSHLEDLAGPGGQSWVHVTDQIGMFCFSGMTPEMVDELATKHSIYMTRNGRISMAGVNTRNVERLAAAMHEVTSAARPEAPAAKSA